MGPNISKNKTAKSLSKVSGLALPLITYVMWNLPSLLGQYHPIRIDVGKLPLPAYALNTLTSHIVIVVIKNVHVQL